ncbi:hypothetical protein DAY19_12175 [Halobacteriovorax vibrionivorans]|uniref:Uncharacterized protein n=1 Tax=Halobacteriovorax vibrionivorans TaxID=2152716 RepID=A0ABY0ICQ8_9BACT|nr:MULTISPECIES: hypothetical protein [Halobacteriovorax]RZF20736.1 hypothetical protein DAY19_12175 [Halobacteriovorax vibrionivorans]TGD48125.1 hypothetical protein EP118_04995 [Halobacteriovorax sp. Y22]
MEIIKLFVFSLVVILSLFAKNNSYANDRIYRSEAKLLSKGASWVDLSFDLSSTLSQHDVDGNEVIYNDEVSYFLFDANINYQYAIMDNFQLLAGLKARYVSSGDSVETITNAGLESFYAGVIYGLGKKRGRDFAISALYRFRPYSVDTYANAAPSDEVILGDGGNDIEFNFLAKFDSTKWTSYDFKIGYRIPGAPISSEIPFEARWVKHYVDWAFWLSANGVYSLGGDEYTDSPQTKPAVSSGYTSRWNSINRQFLALDATAQTIIKNKYLIYGKVGSTVLATSTDKDIYASLGVQWTTGGVSAQQKFEESFKEYTIEANVIKVSPRGVFIKIDHGSLDDIQKGNIVDIYKTDYFGGNILVAKGMVYEVASASSIVKIVTRYRKMPIQKGFAARIK